MAFATTGDVVSLVGRGDKLLLSSSPVSVRDIENLIDGIAAEIDAVLTRIGAPSITSGDTPTWWNLLRQVNALGAAAMLELRLFGEAAPAARGTTRHEILLSEYHRLLKEIETIGAVGDDELAFSGSLVDAYGQFKPPFFYRTMRF